MEAQQHCQRIQRWRSHISVEFLHRSYLKWVEAHTLHVRKRWGSDLQRHAVKPAQDLIAQPEPRHFHCMVLRVPPVQRVAVLRSSAASTLG